MTFHCVTSKTYGMDIKLTNLYKLVSFNVVVVVDNGQYAVLYSVKSENDEILYYEGCLPNDSIYISEMQ
ncbi:hypothetical protein [Peribacillus asahii]|uniref:hypothetical protein n=1 Tax=Peribacillus asahii TaxID=228899 RepID=UPI001FE51051|nr:hypothetical protein [Peribacillus asahii]